MHTCLLVFLWQLHADRRRATAGDNVRQIRRNTQRHTYSGGGSPLNFCMHGIRPHRMLLYAAWRARSCTRLSLTTVPLHASMHAAAESGNSDRLASSQLFSPAGHNYTSSYIPRPDPVACEGMFQKELSKPPDCPKKPIGLAATIRLWRSSFSRKRSKKRCSASRKTTVG
jgi:hypothetical protein